MKQTSKMTYIWLGVIILIGLFLRLYRLADNVSFDFDQEYAAQFAYEVLKVYPLKMIGQGLSVPGLFMGPLFSYFLVPFFLLTHLHPLGGYLGTIVLRIVTVLAYFFIFRQVFNTKTGLITAFLSSILLTNIQTDWTMASFACELPALLSWWCFYQYWRGNYKYLTLLGFLFGLFTSFHPVLFPLYLVFLVLVLFKRKLPGGKILIGSVMAALIPSVPLIAFEYFHKFMEVKVLLLMQESTAWEIKTLQTVWEYGTLLYHYPNMIFITSPSNILNNILPLATLLIAIYLLIKKAGFWQEKFHALVLLSTLFISLAYYVLLPKHIPQYYFTAAFTFLFIYLSACLGLLINSLRGKQVLAVLLVVIFLNNFWSLYKYWNRGLRIALADKDKIVQEISKRLSEDRKAEIHYNIDYGQHYGFGYLLQYYQIESAATPGRPKYEIVLPSIRTQKPLDFVSGSIGLRIIKE